ncbi:CoA transferase [Mycobacterium sp. 94-17]|uniref:CaiB/BaiF CoA transferase family protein n=1 Tax=Mycobacterium sp. 94-17 TaxID=2986147 RepID=UPI002D1F0721|nr:CoA transferase [Mycobacterium sp. 94-17]MEB4209788.1 CoA transferase [Mycobacterium sp. 94-17]
MTNPPRPGALEGIRVVAAEQMIAGPWATQLLARLGAEVIKIEPTTGESGRASVPTITGPDGRPVGATYIRNNLNKKSVGIDIKRRPDLVHSLVAKCDVFLQNSKAGAMDRLGLGYRDLLAVNPRLIYVSVSGFGNTTDSPYRDWPAYAGIAEAMSGVYQWARQPGQPPIINPMGGVGDIGSAMFAALGTLAALRRRDLTGQGEHVDVAMYDSMIALADVPVAMASLGETQRAPGSIISAFAAADGDVVIQISREHQFERLARIIGHPEWLDDPRLATRQGWVTHREDIIRPAVEAWSATRPKLAVAQELAAAGIAAGPCNDAHDVIEDPHVAMRDMLVPFDRGDGGTYLVPGNPMRFEDDEPPPDRRPPSLGEHTDEVLRDLLHLTDVEIQAMRADGVIC